MVPVTTPTTTQTSPTLAELSPAQMGHICHEILAELINTVVRCSKQGNHGPTTVLTDYLSPTGSLSGIDPVLDLAISVATLVSTICHYIRKVTFNCSGCQKTLHNATFCSCGQAQDFPGLLFKRSLKKAITFFTELGKRSSPNAVPSLLSFHVWARVILMAHGVPFIGIVANSKRLDNHFSCKCINPILDTPLTTNSDSGMLN